MLTRLYINNFKLPQDIQDIIKDLIFYRTDSIEGMGIQNTKLLKRCITLDISKATSRTNPSTYMTTMMNIQDPLTSEYWEFTGDVLMVPRYLGYHRIYLSAVNCDMCGNYRYTNLEVDRRSIQSRKRMVCCCKSLCLIEDDEEYKEYANDVYYDYIDVDDDN